MITYTNTEIAIASIVLTVAFCALLFGAYLLVVVNNYKEEIEAKNNALIVSKKHYEAEKMKLEARLVSYQLVCSEEVTRKAVEYYKKNYSLLTSIYNDSKK